jgi:hypothetical protein
MSPVPYTKFTSEKTIVQADSVQELPSPIGAANTQSKRRWWTWKKILASSWLALVICHHGPGFLLDSAASTEGLCPQVPALYPSKNGELFGNVTQLYGTEAYKQRAISWLSGAVRVPYVPYLNTSLLSANMSKLCLQDRILRYTRPDWCGSALGSFWAIP